MSKTKEKAVKVGEAYLTDEAISILNLMQDDDNATIYNFITYLHYATTKLLIQYSEDKESHLVFVCCELAYLHEYLLTLRKPE